MAYFCGAANALALAAALIVPLSLLACLTLYARWEALQLASARVDG